MAEPHIFQVNKTTEAMVGWDRMLESFFGQVYLVDEDGERVEEGGPGDDGMLLWVGASQPQIRTVDDLQTQLRPLVGQLPVDIYRELKRIEVD